MWHRSVAVRCGRVMPADSSLYGLTKQAFRADPKGLATPFPLRKASPVSSAAKYVPGCGGL